MITQNFNKNTDCLSLCAKIFKEYPVLCQFYYRNDREQNGTFTEICEALKKMYQ